MDCKNIAFQGVEGKLCIQLHFYAVMCNVRGVCSNLNSHNQIVYIITYVRISVMTVLHPLIFYCTAGALHRPQRSTDTGKSVNVKCLAV